MGFTQFMIPCLLGSTYYATPENNWDSLYNQYIPQWMIPRGENVARYFFEGLPEGASIPWGAWVVPLSLWFGFFLALAFAMICAMVIMRKQWVDNEKLSYALVQVPMEMMRQEGTAAVGRSFFTNKTMWLGFAVSFLLLSVNGMHSYFPEFPRFEARRGCAPVRQHLAQLLVQPALDRVFLFRQPRHLGLRSGPSTSSSGYSGASSTRSAYRAHSGSTSTPKIPSWPTKDSGR